MSGCDGRVLCARCHCVSDIGYIGLSWDDSRRGGWRKNNLIIHHIPGIRTCP